MPYSHAASVAGVSLRITRLDAEGNLLNGPTDSYLTSAFIRVSFTPEYEEGDEITEKAADGTVCVSFKAPDTLKRVNMEIAVCDPDPELSALMSGGLILSGLSGGNEVTKGWASAQVGEDPSGNGVAVEVWSKAIDNGKEVGYFHWVFPYVKTRLTGDRVIENGLLATTFEGFGLGNIMFRNGPDGSWAWPAATDRPYLYARSKDAPVGLRGFYTYPPVTGVSADCSCHRTAHRAVVRQHRRRQCSRREEPLPVRAQPEVRQRAVGDRLHPRRYEQRRLGGLGGRSRRQQQASVRSGCAEPGHVPRSRRREQPQPCCGC